MPNSVTSDQLALAFPELDEPHQVTARQGSRGEGVTSGEVLSRAELLAQLKRAVQGQDSVVEKVAARLAMSLQGLRGVGCVKPRGVFLFAGPSGVGKTALARGIASAISPPGTGLIRIDMSELSERWGVSRLIGPPPGYRGCDQPQTWLTTRIRQRPNAVVLLDEFEKAAPEVWALLLQVLDDGRLTDGAGRTASFSQAVIVLTSNLGSREATAKRVGFGAASEGQETQSDQACITAIKKVLPPELFNRLDLALAFEPLSQQALVQIARRRLEEAARQLAGAGFHLCFDEDVAELVAGHRADRSLGARPILRAIDELVREPLVDRDQGNYRLRKGTEGRVLFEVL